MEAFASESAAQRDKTESLEQELENTARRETDLRIKLKAAEEALDRAEENLRRAFGPSQGDGQPIKVEDDDARAVLDVLRSGRV